MKRDRYQVHPFPEEGFTRDEELQVRLTSRSKVVDRKMKHLFLMFFLVFPASIALMMWVDPRFVFVCITAGAAMPLTGLFLLPPPRTPCSGCGRRMKKVYELIDASTARYGEFLVCRSCRRYAYTHRPSRR